MADVLLTCAETPLAWPASVDLGSLKVSNTSQLHIFSPTAGSLQIQGRRSGAGDGVNLAESSTVGADYRGQRYSLEEVIFHTPGLHVFPGQTDVYPAEVHIHLKTFSAPQRALTVVVPASHKIPVGPEQSYFAATGSGAATTSPPVLTTLLPAAADLVIYRGPDPRGRTSDTPTPDAQCAPDALQRDFALVLHTASIRATDLERIPREGSASTDPRDLPAPGVAPSQVVPRDRLLRCVTLAQPGLVSTTADIVIPATPTKVDVECKPIKVVGGRDVVDVSGQQVDLAVLLGFKDASGAQPPSTAQTTTTFAQSALVFIGTVIGLLIADWIMSFLWTRCFTDTDPSGRLLAWEPIKIVVFFSIALAAAGFSDTPMSFLSSMFPS